MDEFYLELYVEIAHPHTFLLLTIQLGYNRNSPRDSSHMTIVNSILEFFNLFIKILNFYYNFQVSTEFIVPKTKNPRFIFTYIV